MLRVVGPEDFRTPFVPASDGAIWNALHHPEKPDQPIDRKEAFDPASKEAASYTLEQQSRLGALDARPVLTSVRYKRRSSTTLNEEKGYDARLLTEACRFLGIDRNWTGQIAFVTFNVHQVPNGLRKALMKAFKSREMECLRRAGIPRRYVLEVVQKKGATLHRHSLDGVNRKAMQLLQRLAKSEMFSDYDQPGSRTIDVRKAKDTHFFGVPSRRGPGYGQRGSLALADGSKVRASDHLREDLIRAGIQVTTRRYAKRAPKTDRVADAADIAVEASADLHSDLTPDRYGTPHQQNEYCRPPLAA